METGKREGRWIARLKGCNHNPGEGEWHYLRIRMADGSFSHGGDQNWWRNTSDTKADEGRKWRKPYQRAMADEAFRIAHAGCGVIAMNDLELYLLQQEKDVTREAYQKLVAENWEKRYRIKSNVVNVLVGLYPWKMERGLRSFLECHDSPRKRVKWAPYFWLPRSRQRMRVLETMQDMLGANVPVVFSFHTFDSKRKSLVLYANRERAMAGAGAQAGDAMVNSHYMTVIGLYEYTIPGKEPGILMQVESWGRIYYVRYQEYATRLNYFTNILKITA